MKHRTISVPSGNSFLDGAVFFPDQLPLGTVVFCHGLPDVSRPPSADPSDPGYPGLAQTFAERGYRAVIFNFQGTGQSSGSLEIATWPQDLKAVLDYLDKDDNLKASRYIVVGYSTGGTAAICASAEDHRIDPLITCAAPADFQFFDVGQDKATYFDAYKKAGLIEAGYSKSVEEWAQNFIDLNGRNCMPYSKSRRFLLIHGAEDETVPVAHVHDLADLAQGQVKLILLENAGHRIRNDAKVQEHILTYLDELAGGCGND